MPHNCLSVFGDSLEIELDGTAEALEPVCAEAAAEIIRDLSIYAAVIRDFVLTEIGKSAKLSFASQWPASGWTLQWIEFHTDQFRAVECYLLHDYEPYALWWITMKCESSHQRWQPAGLNWRSW